MGYDNVAGQSECAVLVFAYTAKEAKNLTWKNWPADMDYYTDARANLIKGCEWLLKCKKKDIPHVVENPTSCENCLTWGGSPIDADGICEDCRELENDV